MDINNLHHAYLVLGERESARGWLLSELAKLGLIEEGNPDFFDFKHELFGVDEARALSVKAVGRAFDRKKIFLLNPERITHEAQNALLKTFEEPMSDTHFFLIVREEALILPTLLSRMRTVRVQEAKLTGGQATEFLGLSPAKRLEFAKKFADEEKNLAVFLDDLLLSLKADKSSVSKLKDVFELRRHASDRSASPRLILEHLALIL